jgi:hypothetical protein
MDAPGRPWQITERLSAVQAKFGHLQSAKDPSPTMHKFERQFAFLYMIISVPITRSNKLKIMETSIGLTMRVW